MARKAEVIFVGDASSVVRAARLASVETKKAATQMGALGSTAGRLSSAFHKLGSVAATTGVLGVGLAASTAYALKSAMGFEKQLSSLGAVADATSRQMAALRKQALKAGADTVFSAREAAVAQTELAKGGLRASQILSGGLNAALSLAAAGELQLGDAASYTANAMNLFGVAGSKAGHIADALATAANATTADVSDFGLALTQGGAAAKAAGLSFDETVAALEALAKAGVRGSDAGTSLKAAMVYIVNPSKKAAGAMEELGLRFFDARGQMKSLPQIAGMLRDKLSGLTKEQRLQAIATIAGTDGMRSLLALYDAGPQTLRAFEGGLKRQGSAVETAKRKQDNLAGSLEQLKGSVETAAITMGTALTPAARKMVDAVTRETNRLTPVVERALKRVSATFGRRDLDFSEKLKVAFAGLRRDLGPEFERLGEALKRARLGDKLARAVEVAVPAIANAMASAAPRAASAFIKGFQNAGPWGKLLTLAFIASKLGAFKGAGTLAATNFSKGFALGSAKLSSVARTMMVSAAMSGGFSGRIAGRLFGGKAAAAAGTALKVAPWAAVAVIIAQQLGLDKVIRRQITDAVNSAADWVSGSSALQRIGASVGAAIPVTAGHGGRPGEGGARRPRAHAGSFRRRSATPSFLFPLDRQLSQLEAQRDTLQAGWDAADRARERARLVAAVAAARRGRMARVARAGTGPGATYRTSSGGQLAVVAAGRMLQGMGLQVGESRYFGGVTTNRHKHYPNDHYSGNSIDVNAAGGGSAELGRLRAALATLRGRFGGSLQNALIEDAGAANQHLHATFANARVAQVARRAMAASTGRGRGRRVVDRGAVREALAALRDFDREAARAKKLAQIDVKIKGLERVKAFKDAISGIAGTLKDKLSSAIGEFQSKWEATTGKALDTANAAALDAFDKTTEEQIANGPAAKRLAELQAEAEATAMAAEDAANQQALDDARRSGDPRQIEAAKAAIRETAKQREITKAAKAAEDERKGIEEKRAQERKDLEDKQLAERQARLDAETDAFAKWLKGQLDMEIGQLQTKPQYYAEFVKRINEIFASAGLSPDAFGLGGVQYEPNPDEETALSAPSVRAGGPRRRRRPRPGSIAPVRRHRASGGVMDGYRTIYRTGELGPEDIYVNRAGNLAVRPASQTAQRGDKGGNVYIESATFSGERTAQVLANRWAYKVAHG